MKLLRASSVAAVAAVTVIAAGNAAFAATIPLGAGPQTTYTVQAQPAAGSCTYHYLDKSAGQVLPDASCNPGARNPDVTQSTIGTTICQSGHDLDPSLDVDHQQGEGGRRALLRLHRQLELRGVRPLDPARARWRPE